MGTPGAQARPAQTLVGPSMGSAVLATSVGPARQHPPNGHPARPLGGDDWAVAWDTEEQVGPPAYTTWPDKSSTSPTGRLT
jgi:hypothetical protein